ncbi:MAG: ribosome recycling factor [Planctomycetes bacterium]|nr:ribosome recycling factor [Planctomycetota bacterium]MCA8935291.1 ribosome recycling factor [Planctomycetota bacterium]MCA8946855.1 ribosome recycling factor [Planctomycetota bacterium]
MSRDYDTIMMETEEAMQNVVDHLHNEFIGISAGRASPAMVENIKFDYYGAPTPLKQAATISTPDASTITIKPFDASQTKVINKAILEANIGLTPSDDGKTLICRIPPMTQENRERLVKQLKEIAEKSKVAIRNARHEAIKHADVSLKDSVLTEDDHRGLKEEIQKLTDKFNKELDETLDKKTADVMKV